jgi:palmitoyltransferase ZDHHC13/17
MSEQGFQGESLNDKLFDNNDPEERLKLTNTKRHQSEYQLFSSQANKMGSINDSFINRKSEFEDEIFKNHQSVEYVDMRSSASSNLDEDSIYNISPRVKVMDDVNCNKNKENGTSDSNHGSFLVRPENSRQIPNSKSSSLVSSSKTSVGFLKDSYFQLVELIKYRSNQRLKQELMHNDDVYGPVDMSKKILLHYACEFNSLDVWKILIQWLFHDKKNRSNFTIKEWVNLANSDGLTAIHFAAYRGNNELIEYLISLGANVYANDKDGHNWIHIAAQSDKINTIYYLIKNYRFNINQGDNKLSTPLHWAAFLNKENSLTYLLAWGADPNLQDIDNNTPLHLSVILSCRTGNTRNVKLLLLKGASRNVENNDQYRPIDLINSEVTKAGELRQLLKNASFFSWCMLKPPLTKLRKNERTVAFFLILVFMMIALSYAYIIPVFESLFVNIFSGILGVWILLSFLLVTLKDPGYLKKDPKVNFQELLDTLDPLDICPEWEIILTPRWRHCNICNKCVERFDHHCPYINNCVGYNNHFYFLLYIVSLFANLLHQFALAIWALAGNVAKGESLFDKMYNEPMFFVADISILIITGIFILPVLFLVIVHVTNFMKNKTTNERFSKQKINNTSLTNKMTASMVGGNTSSLLSNVEMQSFMGTSKGNWFSNCISMCDYRPPSQLELRNEILAQD